MRNIWVITIAGIALAGCASDVQSPRPEPQAAPAPFQPAPLAAAQDRAEAAKARAAKADCDRRGGIKIGMTAAEVTASCWGKPERVNTTHYTGGDHQQWVYGYNYVYLRNGVVTSIQTSTR